jgi:hypothetical protein
MSIFLFDHTQDNCSHTINFSPLSDQDGLPFPLHLHLVWKFVLAISLLFTLIEGTRLRLIIIAYIKSPETKLGPINYLIWVDEINSIFLGMNVLFRIIFILSPEPVSILFGSQFCEFANFIGLVYLAGSSIWGSYIALFRVLFIKAHSWLKNTVGIENLLWIMMFVGALQNLIFATTFFYTDEESFVRKTCYHLSLKDLTIMQEYQVKRKMNLVRIKLF